MKNFSSVQLLHASQSQHLHDTTPTLEEIELKKYIEQIIKALSEPWVNDQSKIIPMDDYYFRFAKQVARRIRSLGYRVRFNFLDEAGFRGLEILNPHVYKPSPHHAVTDGPFFIWWCFLYIGLVLVLLLTTAAFCPWANQ